MDHEQYIHTPEGWGVYHDGFFYWHGWQARYRPSPMRRRGIRITALITRSAREEAMRLKKLTRKKMDKKVLSDYASKMREMMT